MTYGVCRDCWSGAHAKCDGGCGCKVGHQVLSMTLPSTIITFWLDGIGTSLRCRAPGVQPFAVSSADEARDVVRSLFSKKATQ